MHAFKNIAMQPIKKTAVVIGAGFSGIGMGIHLKKNGIEDFVILASEDGPGGTWKVNTYPGAQCDVQSHMYSFSFEPYPYWSRMFGLQDEILRYQEYCCEKYGLYPFFSFNTTATKATYQADTGTWLVETDQGQTYECQFLISGSGGLSIPAYPDIKGLHTFKGAKFHSSRWDHSVDLEGKRVAVIGSGASAIQIVPAIIDEIAHLDYYQRSPSWVLPKPDREITALEQNIFKLFPFAQQMYRAVLYAILESRAIGYVVAPQILDLAQQVGVMHVKKYIKDTELRKKMIPNYRMGSKRVLLSNDYYPAVANPKTEVISDKIVSIDKTGIKTEDGKHREVDVIVFCTGFHATDGVIRYDIIGEGGRNLAEEWKPGPEAYLGITASGYPNLFLIMGPNTGLGHNSMIYMIESQINYIIKSIKYMRKAKIQTIDVKPEIQKAFNKKIQKRLEKTVWTPKVRSWYFTKEGKNTTLWPGFTFEYRAKTSVFKPEDYLTVKVAQIKSRAPKEAVA